MSPEQNWFRARLRWAMMAEAEALRRWEKSDCFFRSADCEASFARALAIGRARQGDHDEDTQCVETRLAAVVTLDCPGDGPSVLMGESVAIVPVEAVGFEHVFRPGEVVPPPSF